MLVHDIWKAKLRQKLDPDIFAILAGNIVIQVFIFFPAIAVEIHNLHFSGLSRK
jgi:hypothetical protein